METISRADAEALWASLREAFVNVERQIIEIIETKAWLPIGYSTFSEAWDARMDGVILPTRQIKAHVVYAMLGEGRNPEEIAANVLGVGDRFVEQQRSRLAEGLGPGTHTVRQHVRRSPGEAENLRVRLTHGEIEYINDLCKALGRDRDEEAAQALRAHFKRLERANRGAA